MRGTNLIGEGAQTQAEYAVVIAVITGVIIAALVLLNSQIATVLHRIASVVG